MVSEMLYCVPKFVRQRPTAVLPFERIVLTGHFEVLFHSCETGISNVRPVQEREQVSESSC